MPAISNHFKKIPPASLKSLPTQAGHYISVTSNTSLEKLRPRLGRLLSEHQHPEIPRLRGRLRMGLFFRWSGRRIEIRSAEKNVVRLWIHLQRFCPELRFYRFHFAQLVR